MPLICEADAWERIRHYADMEVLKQTVTEASAAADAGRVAARAHDSSWFQISFDGRSGHVPRSSFRIVGYGNMTDYRTSWNSQARKPNLFCRAADGTGRPVSLD